MREVELLEIEDAEYRCDSQTEQHQNVTDTENGTVRPLNHNHTDYKVGTDPDE